MKLLADTSTLIWWWTDVVSLSARARDLLSDADNVIFVSTASAWEIATKNRLGKLPQLENPLGNLPQMIARRAGKILVMGSASTLRGMKRTSTCSAARGPQLVYV